jgi:hypothetical protein
MGKSHQILRRESGLTRSAGAARKRLYDYALEIPHKAGRGPKPLAALVKIEIARWTPIIKTAGAIVE